MGMLLRGLLRNLGGFQSKLLIEICTTRGFAKGWFPKGWFWRMFPGTKKRNKGAFGCFGEIPPGLFPHVLTVLVFWSWVLLLPRLPPWSRSLRLFPCASILLYGPLDTAWICYPQLPHHPCKNGTHSTCFYSTGGHTPNVPQYQNLDGGNSALVIGF